MQAAINPIILFPPLYSIFPEDNKDAPTNDKTIAAKVTIDFFSLKKINPEKPYVPLNKNDAFQKVQKRRVQKKR